MRERGGAVVVDPRSTRSSRAGARFPVPVSLETVERLLEQPATADGDAARGVAAGVRAARHALADPGATSIARVPGDAATSSAVIVSMPRGDGRLLLSGAMDAWRFRAADGGAFDRFWQSTIAGLALAVPPPIAIDVDPPLLRPGEPATSPSACVRATPTAVSASIDGDQPIRLLPEPERGVYRGRFIAKKTPGRCDSRFGVRAPRPAIRDRARVLVRPDVQRLRTVHAVARDARLVSSRHRRDARANAELERFLRDAVAAPRAPMHASPDAIGLVDAAVRLCLSAEWWLPQARGLR